MKKTGMKRILSLLLTMVVITAVVTAEGSQDKTKAEERSVVIGTSADPQTLTPYASLYGDRYAMLSMIYQPLVVVVGNEAYNVLISGYEETGPNTYTCSLYKNIYDTAGNHFTASDVIFSYETAKKSGNFSILNVISDLSAPDDYTVVITCDDTMVFGQIESILSQVFMVTEAAYTASGNKMAVDPVGTTGYVLAEYVPGNQITFTKADRAYWQGAKPGDEGYVYLYETNNVDTVRYDFISDISQMAMAVETKAIDVASRVSAADRELFMGGGKMYDSLNVYDFTGEHYSITYNCADGNPCSSANMRKALAYAFDAQGIVEGVFNGQGEPATGLNNRYRLDHHKKYLTEDYFGYDLDKAKDYLARYTAETGKSGKDVTITILVVNDDYLEKVSQVMQAYFLKLGVNCDVTSYDSVTRKSIRNSKENWDISIAKDKAVDRYAVRSYDRGYNMLKGHTQAGGWIDDPKLLELNIAACSPESHSMETMTALEDYIKDNAYGIGILIDKVHMASRDWVTDLKLGPYGYVAPAGSSYDFSAK